MSYGTLEVVCGPMFSGKSTELLKRVLCARALEGREVLVIKPAFDTRYAATRVVSHDGLSADAVAVSAWPAVPEGVEAVFIDEVQFLSAPVFEGDVVAEVKALLARGVRVVAAGLDADWRGDAFEVTARLAAMADRLDKLHAHCAVCGRAATKSHKKVQNGAVVELGESGLYEPRCTAHWAPPSRAA